MSELTFSQPFQILSSNGRFTSSGNAEVGYKLSANEGVGVIQFLGTYTKLNWVVTAPEYYSAFNIALTSNPFSGYAAPTTYQFPEEELPKQFNGGSEPEPEPIPNITTSSGNVFSSVNSSVTTVFDGGTLTNGASATTSNAFTITTKGGTIDAGGHDLTFSGKISDNAADTPGTLAIASSEAGGSVILQASNAYTGATTIASGAKLALVGAGSIATSSGVAVDGEFHISGTTSGASVTKISGTGSIELGSRSLTLTDAAGTFAGTIGGTGGVTVAAGSETLTGTNTYSGTTTVADGATLNVGDGGTTGSIGSGTVENRGVLVLNRSNTYTFANAISGNGVVTITGGGAVNVMSPEGALGTMTITGNTVAYLNTVAINNSCHAKIVALNADLAPFLIFSGSQLTVDGGSTLRGAGFIDAPTTVNGTLRPGNSPGTLVFGDSVTQGQNSVLALDIDGVGTAAGAGNYSSVIVNGAGNTYTANGLVQPILRGITGSATNTYSPLVGSIFTVVSATGGVLGSFTGITQPESGLLPNTRFDSIYNPNTFQLVITPTDLGSNAGLTPNEKAVGAALQAARPTVGVRPTAAQAAVYNSLYQLPLVGYAPTYDRISFAIYGDALMNQSDTADLMASGVSAQMAQRRGSSLGTNRNAQKYCLDGERSAKDEIDCRRLTVWGAGIGQFGRTSASVGDPGYTSDKRGFVMGADIEIDDATRVGAFAGYAEGSVDSPGTASKGDLTTFSVGVYGALNTGTVFANALAGYVGGDQKVMRNPLVGATSNKSDVTGAVFAFEIGARHAMKDITFEPHIGLSATRVRRGATAEVEASPLAVRLAQDKVVTALAKAGGRAIWRGKLGDETPVSAVVHTAYGRELGDHGTNVSGIFKSLNTTATVASAARGRDAFLGGATITVSSVRGVDLFARYDAEVSKNASSMSVSAGLKISW